MKNILLNIIVYVVVVITQELDALKNLTENYSNNPEVYDVIVIGAGLSGLTSAYNLRKQYKDINILILEAKDRVGGRTYTVDMNCSKDGQKKKWDLGGQWVSDKQTHITSLLKELNLETYEQFEQGLNVFELFGTVDVSNSTDDNTIYFADILSKIKQKSENINTLDPFINSDEALKLDAMKLSDILFDNSSPFIAQTAVSLGIGSIFGMELDQLNPLYALMYIKSGNGYETLTSSQKGGAQEKKVKGGTQQISEKLLDFVLKNNESKGKILYNRAVVNIDQSENEQVYVTALNDITKKQETYSARKVISAIPINQYSRIDFNPPLPSYKRNLYESAKIGNALKFIITYKTAFWRENGYSGSASSDTLLRVVADATTSDNEPALVGFINSIEWGDLELSVRIREIVAALVRYFGPQAANYIDYAEKNWSLEKYNRGGPVSCVVVPGAMKDYARGTRQPFKNVHFAATEAATQWIGYMDGAIESGIRTANEVLFDLYGNNKELNIQIDYEKTYYFQKEQIDVLKNKNIDFDNILIG